MARTSFAVTKLERNSPELASLTAIDTTNNMALTGASSHEPRALLLDIRSGATATGDGRQGSGPAARSHNHRFHRR